MRVEFSLPVAPFSINAMYYATRKIKTKECRLWENIVNLELDDIKDLVDLKDTWDKTPGVFHVWYEFVFPKRIFFNESGLISSRTPDLSNLEKNLQDLIFNKLGINDKYVTVLHSTKKAGVTHRINIVLELYPNSNVA